MENDVCYECLIWVSADINPLICKFVILVLTDQVNVPPALPGSYTTSAATKHSSSTTNNNIQQHTTLSTESSYKRHHLTEISTEFSTNHQQFTDLSTDQIDFTDISTAEQVEHLPFSNCGPDYAYISPIPHSYSQPQLNNNNDISSSSCEEGQYSRARARSCSPGHSNNNNNTDDGEWQIHYATGPVPVIQFSDHSDYAEPLSPQLPLKRQQVPSLSHHQQIPSAGYDQMPALVQYHQLGEEKIGSSQLAGYAHFVQASEVFLWLLIKLIMNKRIVQYLNILFS